MDIIYESANNFMKLTTIKYHFVFVRNRKSHDTILDFKTSDFRHATGIHHVTDIVIENNPIKLVNDILHKNPPIISDEKLDKSKKYNETVTFAGSIKQRVSDMRFLESCLDTSDFMKIYQIQSFGSFINAEYFIESYCKEISSNVYIFIRKRNESDNYVVVSYFRKKAVFNGTATYWMLKEKISDSITYELFRNPSYQGYSPRLILNEIGNT